MALGRRIVAFLAVPLALGLLALSVGPGSASAQQTVTVDVGDFYFCDPSFQDGVCTTTVNVGDTVSWDFSGAGQPHTTTECGADCDSPTSTPLWDSGIMSNGGTFQHTFDQAGTFLYLCNVHPAQMRGEIVVQAAQQPTTPPATPTSGGAVAPTSTPSGVAAPTTGGGTPDGSSSSVWMFLALAAAGAALTGLGAAAYARHRSQ